MPNQYSSLFRACFDNDLQKVERLLQERNTNINERLMTGENAIHITIMRKFTKLTKFLVERKIDINMKDYFGRTPLMKATIRQNYDIVKILLEEQNIKVNETDCGGNTAALLGKYLKIRNQYFVIAII